MNRQTDKQKDNRQTCMKWFSNKCNSFGLNSTIWIFDGRTKSLMDKQIFPPKYNFLSFGGFQGFWLMLLTVFTYNLSKFQYQSANINIKSLNTANNRTLLVSLVVSWLPYVRPQTIKFTINTNINEIGFKYMGPVDTIFFYIFFIFAIWVRQSQTYHSPSSWFKNQNKCVAWYCLGFLKL